jgi:hypothetical protein
MSNLSANLILSILLAVLILIQGLGVVGRRSA